MSQIITDCPFLDWDDGLATELPIVECGKDYFVITLTPNCETSIEPINKPIQEWQQSGKRRMPKPR